MDITIADESRIDEIAALMQAAYAEFAPAEPGPIRTSWDHYFNEEIPDVRNRWGFSEHLIVTGDDGRIRAVTTYISDGSNPGLNEDRWPQGYAAMRLLAVDPSARGTGLGRALTEECLRRARDDDREWFGLHTTHLMEVARAMYERMGFERFPDNDIPISEDFTVLAYRLKLP